jgi:hypothetical protein
MLIDRYQISSFEDLLEKGKLVENKLQVVKRYKEPPRSDTAFCVNAAWQPENDNKNRNSRKEKPKINKNETASTNEVAAVIPKQNLQKKNEKPKHEKPKIENTAKTEQKEQKKKPNLLEVHGELPKPGECFKCRQTGHLFKNCTNEAIFKIFCYSCGRANKIAPKCPTCKKDGKENP